MNEGKGKKYPDTKLLIQETQRTPSSMNANKITPRHIIF